MANKKKNTKNHKSLIPNIGLQKTDSQLEVPLVSRDESYRESNVSDFRKSTFNKNWEKEFFIDDSLMQLIIILQPRIRYIILFSLLLAMIVGIKIVYFAPRMFSCTAVIAPDLMPDMTSFDFVRMTANLNENNVPIVNQLSQLKILATSSQVKRTMIQELELDELWDCQSDLECLNKLSGIYKAEEIRQVGLKISAVNLDPEFCIDIVSMGVNKTNEYFEKLMQDRTLKSISQINSWINNVTQQIQMVSSEYILFASDHKITDIESQFSAGNALLGSIKQNIVLKQIELTQRQQEFSERTAQIVPLQEAIRESRETLKAIVGGTDSDAIYPALADYESLRMKVQDYQQRLTLLRNQLELFNKQLATAKIEFQKQAHSVMILDEPVVAPVSTVSYKLIVLTFIVTFFLGCLIIPLWEYWLKIQNLLKYRQ